MAETQLLIKEFPKTVAKYCKRPQASISDVVETADMALTERQKSERIGKQETREYLKEKKETLDKLLDYYFTLSLSREYPLISNDLFKLKRYLTLQNGKVIRDDSEQDKSQAGTQRVTTPLFAYTKLFTDHKVNLGNFRSIDGRHERTTTIEATLPGKIDENLREHGKKALGFYHAVLEQAYTEQAIGDILLHRELAQPELGALWIPTIESLKIKTTIRELPQRQLRDPALILTVMDRKYLITTWDAKDEEQFKHYLKKFAGKI